MTVSSAPEETVRRKKAAVPAVGKALDILEELSLRRDGLTMNELVETLGRSMGEIYRVVLYLAERDYIRQDPFTARYSLTPRLFELAHRHPLTERLLHKAIPLLEEIAAASEQSCHLGLLNRSNVLILASVASPRPAGYSVRTGAVFQATSTSSGMVILAYSHQDVVDSFAAMLEAGEREVMLKRLAMIRRQGFDATPSRIVSGVRNLSAPVFDDRGIVAAITCGLIDQSDMRLSPEETLAVIRRTAVTLSRELGHLKA